ncbi:MAG TPA: alpha/beta fold hydrolase, partial [Verrucomicrobiae bacterium]|nr:alpha/beta fold hydrolase [Verrucomicrobiae bacterium]
GWAHPAIWDAATGSRTPVPVELLGELETLAWYPDGEALLVRQVRGGRHRLHRVLCATGEARPLAHPQGSVADAAVRPDGTVWYRWSSGAHPAELRKTLPDGSDHRLLPPPAATAPSGRPARSWSFANPSGDEVQGFRVEPDGPARHATVVWVHGGPAMAVEDTFHPGIQAWVDSGFQVAIVNYRGSTGRGVAWRDRLIGNPGVLEVEDVIAGLDDLVGQGLADPARTILMGASWGGYITLLTLGLHPTRFAAAIALVPVAHYALAYADESEELQAFDRTLFGGSPQDQPERYRERSPSTYVDRVATPLRIEAAPHDSRCPIRQVRWYVERLRQRGAALEYEETGAGHGAFVVDAEVARTRRALQFGLRHVRPGA